MILRFGGIEIDLGRIEVRNGGVPVPVEPQVFDVIAYLAQHRHRVVTKEELLDNVWGDRFVSESALTSRIKSARRALGDTGRDQTVIRTLHGRGYRFVAELAEQHDGPAPDSRPSGRDAPTEEADLWPLVGRHDELDTLVARLDDPRPGGIVVRGTPGVGVSRLLAELARTAERSGTPPASAPGIRSASDIPLAALSSLLPPDVLEAGDLPGDLARGAVFRRARAAIEARAAPTGRIVLVVDDADLLDELSEAVITSLVIDGSVLLVAGHRTPGHRAAVFDELVRGGYVSTLEVPPLEDTDVDVILYRVLAGPVDLSSLERLGAACGGRPGLLRELVDASVASGSLTRDDGVWRLVGPLTSRSAERWPPADLSAAAVRAAEQLALVSTLHVDDADRVLGSASLDELDAAHLLALGIDGDGEHVALADPVLADAIVASIGPRRIRSMKAALLDDLLAGRRRPDDIARAAVWAEELGRRIEPLDALVAARTAMVRGRDDAAELLVDHLERSPAGPSPYSRTIRAELHYRRNQFTRAAELFDAIDLGALDEQTAGFVVRRSTTIDYQRLGRYREMVADLRRREAAAPEAMRRSLAVHRLTLMTLLGDVDDIIEESSLLGAEVQGALLLELRLGRARAQLMRGAVAETAAELDAVEELVREIDVQGPERAMLRDAGLFLRLGTATVTGDLAGALELVRQHGIAARRSSRSWVPLAAAEVTLEAARARLARELVIPVSEAAGRLGFDNALAACRGVEAWIAAVIDDPDVARVTAHDVAERLPRQAGANAWHVATSLGRALVASGAAADPTLRRNLVGTALGLAEEASGVGSLVSAANLWFVAALVDPTPGTAAAVTGRLGAAVAGLPGELWPVRARHVAGRASGAALDDVIVDYERLGYLHLSGVAARS